MEGFPHLNLYLKFTHISDVWIRSLTAFEILTATSPHVPSEVMLNATRPSLWSLFLIFVSSVVMCFGDAPARTAIESGFDESREGWTVIELEDTFGAGPYRTIVRGPHAPRYVKNPGAESGQLFFADSPGNSFYFSAPETFLGNVRDAYGCTLQFDLRAGRSPPGDWYFEPDVILTGTNGVVLVASLFIVPTPQMTTYSTPLAPFYWSKENPFGPHPTSDEFLAVLAGLKSLWIRGEYYSGTDTVFFDDVRLGFNAGVPRRGVALANLVNGFIVGTDLVNPGFGFQTPPAVTFYDPTGLGSGASGAAVVKDGWLIGIEITATGSKYSDSTLVIISPPPRAPTISIGRDHDSAELYLEVWAEYIYRLESSSDLVEWKTEWERSLERDFAVEEVTVGPSERFYRLSEVP
jgi:Laminin B (Domain IV)